MASARDRRASSSTSKTSRQSRGSPTKDRRTSSNISFNSESSQQPQTGRYGLCGVSPACLQRLNTAAWLLFFMCVANVVQSMMVNGLVGTVLTTLERRYDLSSIDSSWIVSAYDISTIPMLMLVSYFGSRSHRSRWTAAGLGLLIAGTWLFLLPQFVAGKYQPSAPSGVQEDLELCDREGRYDRSCYVDKLDTSLRHYLGFFVSGRLLHGLGAVPLYTICVTYLDDCVTKETFSLYIGIFYASGILGPALGYLLGGYFLMHYTDFLEETPSNISTPGGMIDINHQNWVGAWSPGFLLGAGILLLVALPMACFPREVPGSAVIRASKLKMSEAHNGIEQQVQEQDQQPMEEEPVGCKELPTYFKALLMNPTYVFLTIFVCCDSMITSGFTAFGPKYVEHQFDLTVVRAALMFGCIVVPGGAGGTVIGGVIVKQLRMSCCSIMKWEAVFTCAILATAGMFFITCEQISFPGVNTDYRDVQTLPQSNQSDALYRPFQPLHKLDHDCNSDCGCDNVSLHLVCDTTNITQFYSPCHAGCTTYEQRSNVYTDCACVPSGNVTEGRCWNTRCHYKWLFYVLIFCAMFMLFACSSMNISATVRCVPLEQRSLAIGVQWIMLRIFGTVPGPPVFAAAFENACLLQLESCAKTGACIGYDSSRMGINIFIIAITVKLVSFVAISAAWLFYKPPKHVSFYEVPTVSYVKNTEPNNDVGANRQPAINDIDCAAFESGEAQIGKEV